jgi:uncharacterized protein YndB with AHSA1/START domain
MKEPAVAVSTDGMRLVRVLPGPLERVWTYLTDSDKRATWLAPGKFDLRLGGRIELAFDNDQLSPGAPAPARYKDMPCNVEGEITRIEPPRVLAFTWIYGGAQSEVTFDLAPRGSDVELTITHRKIAGRDSRIGIMSGWDTHIGILDARLRGGEPEPFWPTHTRLERDYGERI